MDTKDLLDAIRLRHNLRSDYMVAKLLDVSTQNVSNWRAGRSGMSDDVALRAAALLELDPGYVLVSVAAERAKPGAVRKALATAAAVLASAAATGGQAAAPTLLNGDCVYYVNRRAWRRDRRRSWRPFRLCPALPLLAA